RRTSLRFKALLEGLHKIDDRRLTRLFHNSDLLPLLLLLDQTLDVVAVGVVELSKLKPRGQMLNQTLGHVELLGREFALRRLGLIGLMQFVLVVQRVQYQTAIRGPDEDNMLAIMHRNLGNRVVLAFRERRHEQGKRFTDFLFSRYVIG